MGMVISFPTERLPARSALDRPHMPGQVVILPAIRIERALVTADAEPGSSRTPTRKRRRRASRS